MVQDITAPKKSNEDYIEEEHYRYLQMVSESGVPLWVLDLYSQAPACSLPLQVTNDLRENDEDKPAV